MSNDSINQYSKRPTIELCVQVARGWSCPKSYCASVSRSTVTFRIVVAWCKVKLPYKLHNNQSQKIKQVFFMPVIKNYKMVALTHRILHHTTRGGQRFVYPLAVVGKPTILWGFNIDRDFSKKSVKPLFSWNAWDSNRLHSQLPTCVFF